MQAEFMAGMSDLSLATLGQVDRGFTEQTFAECLERVKRDFVLRQALDKPRVIDVKLKFVPTIDGNGKLASVTIEVIMQTKLPGATLVSEATLEHRVDGQGEVRECLLFRGHAPENPRQATLADVAGPKSV